jgi:UDP-N-acetylmuramoyl-L-alanyl-D-glutamate--2,6-diaminopimelate ligase
VFFELRGKRSIINSFFARIEKKLLLKDLLSYLPQTEIRGDPEVEVKGLAYHSAEVQEGFLFAAIRGMRDDGTRYVEDALTRGARVLLLGGPLEVRGPVQVVVPDVREALARLASAFYGNPSSSLTLIGITGTNGKTTTSYLLESILEEDGKKVGVIGTVNYRFQGRVFPAPTTTPESLDLQKNLQTMREAGVTHAVLEVSSHALDLQRVRGCDFDVALFTNLTRDHLDYHRSMDEYFRAKQLLFTQCLQESKKERRFAVVNADDPRAEELVRMTCGTAFRYGLERKGELWARSYEEGPEGLKFQLVTPRGDLAGESSLIGLHNLYNLLAAVSAAEVLKVSHRAILAGIAGLTRVPGRLERIPGGDGVRVFVDYAHTPDALERALEALQKARGGRLIVVFGCGGDRDRGKRPEMGKAASAGSDLAVITSDNPRTEDPLRIVEEIEKGVSPQGRKKYKVPPLSSGWEEPGYLVIPDRREAIRAAIGAARAGDVVLIAGKGHEDYQIMGKEKVHFDDREEAAEALAWIGGKAHR